MRLILILTTLLAFQSAAATDFDEALELANEGNAEAQFQIGEAFAYGIEVEEDYPKSIIWYEQAAASGSSEAMSRLGHRYWRGIGGVRKDLRAAINWFEKASQLGDDFTSLYVAAIYDSTVTSDPLIVDDRKAFRWYLKAANTHQVAQERLADMYYEGRGIPVNFSKAFYWHQKLSNKGRAISQFHLGLMYADGEGVNPSDVMGYVWLSMAIANGMNISDVLQKHGSRMIRQQIADGQALASKCYESNYKDCD